MTTVRTAAPPTIDDSKLIPVRHPTRLIITVVIAVLVAMMIHLLATNKNFEWHRVWHYLFSSDILTGMVTTLKLTGICMVISVVLGTILAIMRMSQSRVASTTAWLYIWFFRGTPLIVQVIFWYNITVLTKTVSIGIPFGPSFATTNSRTLIDTFTASILALSLHETAFMSEIIRSGIGSVERGQIEAATALGLSRQQIFRKVIFRQAMRVIIPPIGNQTINMLKTTAVVSVIALPELLYSAELIYSVNYQVIPLLVVASIWYLIIVTVLSIGQHYIERHYSRGYVRTNAKAAAGPGRPTAGTAVALEGGEQL